MTFSFIMAGVLLIIMSTINSTDDPQRKFGVIFFTLMGCLLFGNGLNMLGIAFIYTTMWCIGYILLVLLGRWLMREMLKEHLITNAYGYVKGLQG